MIEVKSLTKVYNEGKDNCVYALHDISFTLPEKGLVFILGKSGSGKSTLINMLGMLDTPSYGDIIIDGNSFKDFDQDKINGYRDNYLGFIFQNYCLLDNLTVYDNVKLAYNLSNLKIDNIEEVIDSYLSKLGLLEYKYHNANQLSGGQCQRVAICRALIKNPKMILADEPTGNLDSKVALTIFDELKEISKDRLVVVISHDVSNSYEYADRIIEIKDGKLFKDITKNKDYVEPTSSQLVLSNNSDLDEDNFNKVKKVINKYNYELIKKDSKYLPTVVKAKSKKYEADKYEYKFSNSMFIAKKFMKSNTSSSVFTTITVSIIIVLLCISQIFLKFDSKRAINNALNESEVTTFVMNKGYKEFESLKSDRIIEIEDGDIDSFYEAGYEGNIYKLVDQPLLFVNDDYKVEKLKKIDISKNYEDFFARSGLGTLICDREYLEKLYCDENTDLEDLVLAGSLDNLADDQIIITDFMAESWAYYNESYDNIRNINKLYSKIVEKSSAWGSIWSRYKVGAVIDTRYKERYENLIDLYFDTLDHPENSKKIIKKIVASEDYSKFVEERDTTLNIGYTFNQDFEKTLEDSRELVPFVYMTNGNMIDASTNESIYVNNVDLYSYDCDYCSWYYNDYKDSHDGYMLSQGEAIMQINYYNDLFDKDINDLGDRDPEFEEKTIIIQNYRYEQDVDDETIEPLSTLTLTIKGVSDGDGNQLFILNHEDLLTLKRSVIYTYSLYFDNTLQTYEIFSHGRTINYTCDTTSFTTINTVCNIIDIFNGFFAIIASTLVLMALLLIVSYSIRNVKLHRKDIGIIEALGADNKTISIALIIEMITICIITFVVSSILTYITSMFANIVVKESLSLYYTQATLNNLDIFTFRPIVLLTAFASLALIGLVSVFAPYKALKKISPAEIIKTGE